MICLATPPPPAPSTWQEEFERDLPYYTRYFGWAFRYLDPELREENTQEAIVQAMVLFAAHADDRNSGPHWTDSSYGIAKYAANRVKRGASCTRPKCKNSDLLDRTLHRTNKLKPAREVEYLQHIDARESRPGVSPEFAVDFETWTETLPQPLLSYAALAVNGASTPDIQRTCGVSQGTACRYRKRLRDSWEAYYHV